MEKSASVASVDINKAPLVEKKKTVNANYIE
jgi:hypothetical protein